jgi:predicted metalloprotease with PDZ domain
MPLLAPVITTTFCMIGDYTDGVIVALISLMLAAQPIRYTVTIVNPSEQVAGIEAAFPTDGRASIEIMMPIWSPGFYKVENYATRILSLTAKSATGASLDVEHPADNRWRVLTGGASEVVVSYRLTCRERSVTTNWIDADYAVLTGPATFITEVGAEPHSYDVQLRLPASWRRSMTGLMRASDGMPDHYVAADYDTLVDSPIVAGNPVVQEFDVRGTHHAVVEIGAVDGFDGARAAADLKKMVEAQAVFWGGLPFKSYAFLLVFRPGGGGLEHQNSMLATTRANATSTAEAYRTWLNFISHEYCHAFNVKRLRPIELGPFDYEREPHTTGLWISEGFTSYIGELAVERAGLTTRDEVLRSLSSKIEQLQKTPGRLRQTLEQSSADVWTSESISGVNTNRETSVSYYLKGEIAAFLLDAEIRRDTRGVKSLDDLMQLALQRFGGAHGFTARDFQRTASEVAGDDLGPWFARVAASTAELEYADALDWFGLRFVPDTWTIEPVPDPSAEQLDQLNAWLPRR